MNIVSFILEPFSYPFMQNALLTLILVSFTSGILGVFVIVRRMAFIGDALAHTALPGVVAAFFLGWELFWGGLVAAIITSLIISWFSRSQEIHEDTAIGIAFTGMFALGIALMSVLRTFRDLLHVLFGNILAVNQNTLVLIAVVSTLVLLIAFFLRKELVWTSVDPIHASTQGLSPHLIRTILLLLIAVVVTVDIQAVGVVLTSSLLITPAASANLLTKRLIHFTALAVLLCLIGGIIGLYASYYLSISSGAAIVLTNTLIFGFIWTIKMIGKSHGKKNKTTANY